MAKVCKTTNHETVVSFLNGYINVYITKFRPRIRYGKPTYGTGLVERTIQSLKKLVLDNLEDDQNLRESVNRALYVLRFTIHSETKKTPFETHFGRAQRTRLSNLKNSVSVDSKDFSVYITRNSEKSRTTWSCPRKRRWNRSSVGV